MVEEFRVPALLVAAVLSLVGGVVAWYESGLEGTGVPACVVVELAKVAAIGAVVGLALPGTLERCHGQPRRASRILAAFAIATLTILLPASAARDSIARRLDDCTARFVPTSALAPMMFSPYTSREAVVAERWKTGVLPALELLVFLAAQGAVATLGVFLGHRSIAATALAVPTFLMVLFLGTLAFDLVWWEYDFFFAGTLTGPVLLDFVLVPFPTPGACLSLPLLGAFLVTAAIVCRDTTGTRPSRAKSNAAVLS